MSNQDDRDMQDGDGEGGGRVRNDDPLGLRRRRAGKKRPPAFTLEVGFNFDHKDPQQLRYFLTDRGKISPRRVSGLTAKQQRALTAAIKRARNLGLLPYTVKG
jgi:small subunit ribosomal protein S18